MALQPRKKKTFWKMEGRQPNIPIRERVDNFKKIVRISVQPLRKIVYILVLL